MRTRSGAPQEWFPPITPRVYTFASLGETWYERLVKLPSECYPIYHRQSRFLYLLLPP